MAETIWDDKKVKKLQELLGKGLSTSEIGKRLGVSKNTIIGKVHRLKLAGEVNIVKPPVKSTKTKPTKKEKNLFSFSFSSKKKDDMPVKKEVKKASEILIKERIVIEKSIEVSTEDLHIKNESLEVDVKDSKPAASFEKSKEKRYQLKDLKGDMCRWAYGEPNSANFFFCGEKTFKNKPYCLKHSEVAYASKKNYNS